jgi:hypothetical protein
MGNPVQNPQPPQLPAGYQVGSTIVPELPAERAFPLKNSDFLTLCDGNTGNEKAGRDLCIGLFGGAIVGLIGLVYSLEIPEALTKRSVFWSFIALVVMLAGSLAGGIVCQVRISRENTPYTRLQKVITSFFD